MKWQTPVIALAVVLSLAGGTVRADDSSPLRIFGYFQNSFQHIDHHDIFVSKSENTFVLQQLNFFMQKDVSTHWSAFVDFEVVNSFSSKSGWGNFSIEEAWVKYRYDNRFCLKLGLLIPTFNHFNEIKNRAPLLPYIIKPLVYDASLAEDISIDRIIPTRSFVQAYGFFPFGRAKLDYAIFLGNSPNINSNPEFGQTGIDTTNTFLIGGRVGVRWGELKAGVSATYDKDNSLANLGLDTLMKQPPGTFSELNRTRLGTDLQYRIGPISFEGEVISDYIHESVETVDFNLLFYYATLGAQLNDKIFIYGSYWATDEDYWLPPDVGPSFLPNLPRDPSERNVSSKFYIPNGGVAYAVNDRVTIKGQVAHVKNERSGTGFTYDWNANYYSLGVSVFF